MNEVFVYEIKQHADNPAVIEALSQLKGWDPERTRLFAHENDVIHFFNVSKNEKEKIAQEFQKLGLLTTFGSLYNKDYYLPRFKKLLANSGRYQFDINLAAFFLTGFWQLWKGLAVKFIVYLLLFIWLISFLINIFNFFLFSIDPIPAIFCWVISAFFYGAMANYDLFLKLVLGENLWPDLPYRKAKWLFWLVVPLIILLTFVVIKPNWEFEIIKDEKTNISSLKVWGFPTSQISITQPFSFKKRGYYSINEENMYRHTKRFGEEKHFSLRKVIQDSSLLQENPGKWRIDFAVKVYSFPLSYNTVTVRVLFQSDLKLTPDEKKELKQIIIRNTAESFKVKPQHIRVLLKFLPPPNGLHLKIKL